MNERTTVGTYGRAWLAGLGAGGACAATLARYGFAFAHFLHTFGRRRLGRIAVLELRLWLADRRRDGSASSARLEGRLVRQMCRDAVSEGILRRSPALGLRLPPVRRDPLPLPVTFGQVRLGLDSSRRVRAPWSFALSILLEGGLRLGELVSMRWADVSEGSSFHVRPHGDGWSPKAGSRVVPFSRRARRDVDGLRLCGRRSDGLARVIGVPGSVHTVGAVLRRRLRWACEEAGLPRLWPHALRHLWVSRLIDLGTPMPVVQALAGHSSLAVTTLYAHQAPGGLVAAMGRF